MSPQELINHMIDIQQAANAVTFTHAALSHAIGEFVSFLGSEEEFDQVVKHRDNVNRHLLACVDSLNNFCDAVNKLHGRQT